MTERRLRVLLVTDNFYPNVGGIQEHVLHLAITFQKMGHHADILTGNPLRRKELNDPPFVKRVGYPFKLPANESTWNVPVSPRINKRVKEIVQAGRYDVVHIQGPPAPFITAAALKNATGVKVATYHGNQEKWGRLHLRTARKMAQRYAPLADGFIAVSSSARETALRMWEADYRIIPNGVDTERFNPRVPHLERFLDGRPNVLFVGRLDRRKGIEYLLTAMSEVERYHPEARLLVVGQKMGRKNYRKYVPDSVKDSVVFVGRVPPAELPRYFTTADIFVSPATGGESFGIVLVEAMASAVPVVASDIGGYRDVITEGVHGVLVEPKNPAAIARAVVRLLSDRQLRERMGLAGRERAVSLYDWKKVAESVMAFYRELLAKRPSEVAL